MDKKQIIFDLTDETNNYRGVLFAEMDNAEVDKQMNSPFPTPKEYVAGVMAVIWTDKNGGWHAKLRIKFPSENKQVISMDFTKPEYKNVKVNETFVLQQMYKMPMVKKIWTPNPSGEAMGIVDIIRDLDMVESSRLEVMDAKN